MESIPLNSVLVSSYHYADLVESDAAMHTLRNYLLNNLAAHRDYSGRVKLHLAGDDNSLIELLASLFPDHFSEKADRLIAKYIEEHPGEEDE